MARLSGSVERAMTGDLEFSGGALSGRYLGFEAWDHDPAVRYPVDTILKHNNKLWWASQEPAHDDEPGVTTNSVWIELTATGVAPPPTPTVYTYYLGLRSDSAFVPADFAISGTDEALTVAGIPAGERRHIGYARPASLGNFSYVYLYTAGSRNTINQIGAWTQLHTAVTLGGVDCHILYSSITLDDSANGFIVEAG